MAILQHKAAGAGPLSATVTVPDGRFYKVVSVALHLSAAPTTSENMTAIWDNALGEHYDVTLYSLNLASASTTDLIWWPDGPVVLGPGDALDVQYTNTDGRTYGLTVTLSSALGV